MEGTMPRQGQKKTMNNGSDIRDGEVHEPRVALADPQGHGAVSVPAPTSICHKLQREGYDSEDTPTSPNALRVQLNLDFELLELPQPEVVFDNIRSTDTKIGKSPLAVPAQFKHGKIVLEALQNLSDQLLSGKQLYGPVQVGYTELAGVIREICGRKLSKSGIGWTLNELVKLGFVKRGRPADFSNSYEYQALTTPGMIAMLEKAQVKYFRVEHNKVKLIVKLQSNPK
jgi:hypothetical protein